jgi:threonine aldolase
MRNAIATAPVGDEVIDRDPTVALLEEKVADLLGKEAAIFMPSGTMTNQVAVRLHCKPGDEFICESGCHIFNYEQGGYAQLSGVVARPIPGQGNIIAPAQLKHAVSPNDQHACHTRLLSLENTHNKGGGIVLPYDNVAQTTAWAKNSGLATHLDGARFFNAVVASGIAAKDWAQHFDTISVCFSKGLGAPVGSALVGARDMIYEAARHRKLFGGGMRQAGIIAAGALYALDNNIDRLAEDHQHAKNLAQILTDVEGIDVDIERVQTNIVIFKLAPSLGSASDFCDRACERGVSMLPFSHEHVRAVTHLHIDSDQANRAGQIIAELAANPNVNNVSTPANI